MELTREEGRDVVYDDHEDWDTIETDIVGKTRWAVQKNGIFRHVPSGKFYSICWEIGATEYQDVQAFEYDEPELFEVHQVERTVKVWEKVKK